MTSRVHDTNGWFEVPRNPISRVGIFDYSGAQIGAPAGQEHKVFRVYRPAEELQKAVDSFKLLPFIDDHTMLGKDFTSADEVPIAGVIGEQVFFEGDTLYGNPKVYSEDLAQKIKSGKTELSCGYRCRYEFTPGTFNGEAYDVVQRDILGNHLALVDEGRMGAEVAILDQKLLTFTVDAKEPKPMEEQLAQILEALTALTARVEAMETAAAPVADEDTPPVPANEPVVDEEGEEPAADEDPASGVEAVADLAEELAAVASEVAEGSGMDAKMKGRLADIRKRAAKLKAKPPAAAMDAATKGRLAALEGRPAMDEATFVARLARKNDLAAKLSKHVGTFTHDAMTVRELEEYGVQKLGIKGVPKGHEGVALDAYLQAKPAPGDSQTYKPTEDAAPKGALAGRIAKHR